MTFTTGDPDGIYPSTSVRNIPRNHGGLGHDPTKEPLTPVRIPTTPDGQDTAMGHPARTDTPLSLRAVIDDALATSPTDHIVTVNAAHELIDHLERALIDASGGEHHLVRITGYAWTLQHPITERFTGTLFDCPYASLVEQAPFEADGTYRVWLDRQALRWEPVN